MKKLYFILILLASSFFANAQCSTPVMTTANGNSTLGRAPSGQYMSIRTVYLVTAAEMAAAGFLNGQSLSEIGWSYATLPTAAVSGNLNVYLENTLDVTYSKTTNWTTATASMISYLNAPTTLPAVIGAFNIPLTSSFTYSGGGVYVAFEWENCGTPIGAITVNCNTDVVGGLNNVRSTVSCIHGTAMAGSSFRPITSFGTSVPNDATVTYIYNQGEMAVGKSSNIPFGATVKNNSGTALTNIPVTLDITGANTFTTSATIASLPACSSVFVSFPTTYTPTNEGTDVVTVSIPPDANNANNSETVTTTVNKQDIAYKNVGEISTGGAGFNAGTGTIAARFTTAVPAFITHANLEFNTVTIPSLYKIAIYPDVAGAPGTVPIYVDAANRTNATGSFSLLLDVPVSVPAGTFYLALQQASLDNMASGFTAETPVRAGTFFFSSNPPVAWTDFSAAGFNVKLISGVKFCTPETPNGIVGTTSGCEGAPHLLISDTIGKYGAASFTWILPAGYSGSSTTDSIYVTPGNTTDTVKCVAVFPCGISDTVKVEFVSTPATTGLAQSNATNTVSNAGVASGTNFLPDGLTAYYHNASCNPIAIVSDFPMGNTLGNVTAEVTVDATVSTYNGQPYCRRWFTITPASNGGANVGLLVSQADFVDYNTAAVGWPQMPTSGNNSDPNIANVRVTKVDGVLGTGPATVITPTLFWTGDYWIVQFQVNNFSSFYLHGLNPANQALPVTWHSFTAAKEANATKLNWATSSEKNCDYYQVQHSVNGKDFKTIATVASKSSNGNSDNLLNYDYKHTAPITGHNYYRIEQVDLDKNSTFSAIRDLIWGSDGNSFVVYPQPANKQVYIDAQVGQNELITIELADMTGKVIMRKTSEVMKGLNNLSLEVDYVNSGFYLLKIIENNQLKFTQKVNIIH